MKKLLLFFAALLIAGICGMAQPSANKDSLLQELKKSKEDTEKVKLQLKIGGLWLYDNYDSANKYYQDAFALR